MSKVIIMRGISGSGKSTAAKALSAQNGNCPIFSTDDYFIKNGTYQFDGSKIATYHHRNQTALSDYLSENPGGTAIVDNTNIQLWQIEPYLKIAGKHGCDVQIVEIEFPGVDACASRNVHGLDGEIIQTQANKYQAITREWINKMVEKYEVEIVF